MRFISILSILLSISACTRTSPECCPELKAGDALPQFSAISNSGTTVSNTDFDKGVGLIVFFNTSCGDCREELPIIQDLYLCYQNKVQFIAISRAEKENSVRQYWKDNNLTIPYSAQNDDTLFRLFAPHTIPRIYLIKDGIIIATWDDNPIMQKEDFTKYI